MSDQQAKRDFTAFEDVGRTLDRELQRLIEFVNNKVVPAAHQDTEALLRRAADRLHELADRLAARRQPAPAGESPEQQAPEEHRKDEQKNKDP